MATQDELTRRYKGATSTNNAGAHPSTLPYTGGTAQATTLPGTGTQAQATNKPYITGSTAQTAAPSVVKPTQPVAAATVQPAATPTPAPAAAAPAAGTTATGPDWAYIMNSVSDPYLKAIAEQQRNAKIDAQGLNYAKTNDYAQYLGGDFSTMSADQLNTLSGQLSGAWKGASPETQRQLHDYKSQVMAALDELNGTTSYYDPFSGTWTTERSTTEKTEKSGEPGSINLPTRDQNYDLTEYLRQQKAAEVEAALAGLKGAYEKSMAGYRDTASRIPEYYQNQKNQAAGASAVNQANFNEIAAAQGLNSGAFGQAALSRGNALAANLTALGQSQANAQKDVELQMAQLTAEYQSAIAKAQAEGNADLARSLYNELVRVQNLVRSDYQFDVEQAFRQAQFEADRADKAFNQNLQTEQWQASRDNAAKAAQDEATQNVINWLKMGYDASGIPQELIAASGLTPEMLSYYTYLYNPNAAYTGSGITSTSGITGGYTGGGSTGGGVTSGGGTTGGGSTSDGGMVNNGLNQAAFDNALVDYYASQRGATGGDTTKDGATKQSTYDSIVSGAQQLRASGKDPFAYIAEAYRSGLISPAEYAQLLVMFPAEKTTISEGGSSHGSGTIPAAPTATVGSGGASHADGKIPINYPDTTVGAGGSSHGEFWHPNIRKKF